MCVSIIYASMHVFVLHAMALQLTSALDGGTLEVSAPSWHDLVPSVPLARVDGSIALPISFALIERTNAFLTADPHVMVEEQPFDASFACGIAALHPAESAHAVHVLAQQAAHVYHQLFMQCIEQSSGKLTDEQINNLEAFWNTCPTFLRMHTNFYACLLYTYTNKRGCLCSEFNNLLGRVSGTLMHTVEDLPRSRQQVLQQAVIEKQEDIALYALAFGADPQLPVRIKSCRCCERDFLIPKYYEVPLARFCAHMPRLIKKLEEKG